MTDVFFDKGPKNEVTKIHQFSQKLLKDLR